ncbi:Hypothetical protein ST64987_p0003 (plasmid) [Streptococcus thermophilus]|nr:Hypothetical protein ST64987_p0003 [Streptococcus thermophilus]
MLRASMNRKFEMTHSRRERPLTKVSAPRDGLISERAKVGRSEVLDPQNVPPKGTQLSLKRYAETTPRVGS